MLLLDITISTPLIVVTISSVMIVFLALVRFVWSIIDNKHNEAMKRLDRIVDEQKNIEQDLKPLTLTVAEHTVQISVIKEELKDQKGWLTAHDTMIQEWARNSSHKPANE